MVRCVVLGAVLAACNLVHGIEETKLVDGDQPPEDPICTPAGTAPLFRPTSTEIISRNCFSYTTSEIAGRAVAGCLADGMLRVEEGEIDGPLAPAQLVTNPSGVTIARVWLAPEGDLLVVHQYISETSAHQIALYTRQGDQWRWSADAATASTFISAGVPSAAPGRRLIVSSLSGYSELVQQGTTWTEVRTGTWASLGGNIGDSSNLSPDGLQLIFTVNYTPMYTRRTSVDEAFPPAVPIDTLGQARDVFLESDCGKAYFSGLSSVFYRYQL